MGSGPTASVVMSLVAGYPLAVGSVSTSGTDCPTLEVCVSINSAGNGAVITAAVKRAKESDYKKSDDASNNCVLDGKMYEPLLQLYYPRLYLSF